jgi:hypothetical protein
VAESPPGSSLPRAILGVISLLASLVVLAIGFVLLVMDLDAASIVRPVAVLVVGGFLLAAGIALLIWEMSVRYDIRR